MGQVIQRTQRMEDETPPPPIPCKMCRMRKKPGQSHTSLDTSHKPQMHLGWILCHPLNGMWRHMLRYGIISKI